MGNKYKSSNTGAGKSFIDIVVHESELERGVLGEGSDVVIRPDPSLRMPNRNALVEIRCNDCTYIGRCGERKNGGYSVHITRKIKNDYQC